MNPFHDHLEICRKCRENPFALCDGGKALLKSSATGAGAGEPVETARLRGEVLRLALLAATGSEADFLAAARALAAAICAPNLCSACILAVAPDERAHG